MWTIRVFQIAVFLPICKSWAEKAFQHMQWPYFSFFLLTSRYPGAFLGVYMRRLHVGHSAQYLSTLFEQYFSLIWKIVFSSKYRIIEMFQDFRGNVPATIISWAVELVTIIYNARIGWEAPSYHDRLRSGVRTWTRGRTWRNTLPRQANAKLVLQRPKLTETESGPQHYFDLHQNFPLSFLGCERKVNFQISLCKGEKNQCERRWHSSSMVLELVVRLTKKSLSYNLTIYIK